MEPSDPTIKKTPPAAIKHSKTFDATSHLQQTLPRKPGEMIKIRRIPDSNSYRVNWYDPCTEHVHAIPGLTIRYIRQSQFLNCHLDETGKPLITYPVRQ